MNHRICLSRKMSRMFWLTTGVVEQRTLVVLVWTRVSQVLLLWPTKREGSGIRGALVVFCEINWSHDFLKSPGCRLVRNLNL